MCSRSSRRALLLAVTWLALACGSESAPTGPTSEQRQVPRTVVVLGDSLAVSPSRGESFPAVLEQRIQRAGLPWTVVNAGISGDTTEGGAARIGTLLGGDVGVLVLALGANDGLGGVPVARVEQNLSAIIEAAEERGVKVLLCGMETLPTHGWSYMQAFHEVFPRVSARHDVPLVPFLLTGVALVPELNGPDRMHPNAAGARRIADNVWPHLERLLQSAPAPRILGGV